MICDGNNANYVAKKIKNAATIYMAILYVYEFSHSNLISMIALCYDDHLM